MKAVHHKVNIVPVIAKADTLTRQEVMSVKKRVGEPNVIISMQLFHGYLGDGQIIAPWM